jgi:hypothetical protein
MTTLENMTFEISSNGSTKFVGVRINGSFYCLSLDDKLAVGRKVSEKYGSGFRYIGASDGVSDTYLQYMKK